MMKRTVILLLTLVLLLTLCCCGKKNNGTTWQEQYDLGVRYLSDGNYEEAIIAFTAAIEIDPKRADSYLRAAEAYEAIVDIDSAIAILQQGVNAIGTNADDSLTTYLYDLMFNNGYYDFLFTDDFLKPEDWLVGDIPISDCSLRDFADVYSKDKWSLSQYDDSQFFHAWNIDGDTNTGGNLLEVSFYHRPKETMVQPDIRNIILSESYEQVMKKIGFTDVGAQYLRDGTDKAVATYLTSSNIVSVHVDTTDGWEDNDYLLWVHLDFHNLTNEIGESHTIYFVFEILNEESQLWNVSYQRKIIPR